MRTDSKGKEKVDVLAKRAIIILGNKDIELQSQNLCYKTQKDLNKQ